MAYHSKTISLLGLPIRTSPVARQTLDDLAKTVNQPLPAAVREWYELEDAVELIGRFSNCDHPVPIDALKRSLLEVRKEGLPDPRQNTFLVFKSENQGVYAWAVLLDGSDDPPVFLDFDSAFNSPVKCADAFSQYLYSCIWDYSQVLAANSLLLQAQNSALSDEALESLCQSFDQECVTFGWPGERQFRFSRGDQRILIWANDSQADWFLHADKANNLESLVRIVGRLDSLGKALWSNDPDGQSVLTRCNEITI